MRFRLLDILLTALVAITLVVMALSIPDPIFRDLVCSNSEWACLRSEHYDAWNRVLYDVGLGSFVSLVFYFLVVKLPELSKRLRIKRGFQENYASFKEECIAIFLLLADGSYQSDLPKRLCLQSAFRDYFKVDTGEGQDRWHRVANGLKDYYLQRLLNEMEAFREEVFFVLNNVDLDSDDDFAFLKRLSVAISSAKLIFPGYDNKLLLRFLWSMFAGWDLATGYRQSDIVEDMIRRI